MYFLLILLLIIKLIISHITLPFFLNEISLNNLNHSLIMESLYKTNLIINISLGSPEQNLQLIIKHSIFDLIIPSSQLKTKKPINKFNENVSLTYNKSKRRLNPIEGIIESYESSDVFNFKTKNLSKVENINFLLVTNQSDNFINNGIFGLKPFPISKKISNMNIIKQLKEKNIINNYDYYIHFLNEKQGEMIIGILPHENNNIKYNVNVNDYILIPVIKNHLNVYKFYHDNIYYGNIEVKSKFDSKLPNELEIGIGLIRGSNSYKNIIEEKFFNISDKCFIGKFLDNYEYVFYYCDKNVNIKKFQDLTFIFKDFKFNLTLTYKDLFFEFGGYYYFLVYFHQQYNSGFTLGIPFFKKYLVTFNQDKKVIGFYRYLNDKSYFNISWPLIICIIIILIMTIYIFVFRPKNIKKKRANELDDDFEYLSKDYHKLNKNELGI